MFQILFHHCWKCYKTTAYAQTAQLTSVHFFVSEDMLPYQLHLTFTVKSTISNYSRFLYLEIIYYSENNFFLQQCLWPSTDKCKMFTGKEKSLAHICLSFVQLLHGNKGKCGKMNKSSFYSFHVCNFCVSKSCQMLF